MAITTRTAVPLDLAAIVEIYNQAIASNSTGHLEPAHGRRPTAMV